MSQMLKWASQDSDVFYSQILSLLNLKLNRSHKSDEPFLIAIDGNCGSGKSTLALFLQSHYEGNLFHMDDFYLPWVLKTPERLIEPGGNIFHERFQSEVLNPLKSGVAFSYQPYDCKTETLMAPRTVEPKRLNIVEGSYSMHPKLIGSYDFKIFLSISETDQAARILARNGEDGLKRFQDLWIPLENKYFEACAILECADVVVVIDSI